MMMTVRTSRFALMTLAAAILASAAPRAAADVVTFDNANDLANNFSLNGTAGYYVQQASGGVNNSGSVAVDQVPGGNASAVLKTAFNLTNPGANALTMSMFFKLQNNTQATDAVELGIVGNVTDQLNAATVPSNFVAILQQEINGGTSTLAILRARATNAFGGGTDINLGSASTMSLSFSHFYRLTVTISPGGNESGLVEDFGTTGTTNLGTVPGGSGSNNAGNVGLLGDPSVFAAFRTPDAGGGQTIDTFTATPVPEPSALCLVALAGGMGVAARRARSRRANA